MGYCGLPELGRRGEFCRSDTGNGRQCTRVTASGNSWEYSKPSLQLYARMQIWKMFRLIPHPVKCIKAPMVGEKAENKAVGVSKGGRNTKIHTLVDGLGNPLAFLLSPGNDHDSKHAIPLLGQIKIDGSNILGDKAYGAKAIRDYIDSQGAAYTIPPKSDINDPWPVDWHTYTERHLVECFFQKLKWFRRIFTRYDKLDDSFLAFVYLAAIVILLK